MSFDPNVHVGVAGLIFDPDDGNALLMHKRSATVSHGAGKWSVPGGWVNQGEHPEDALIREIKEEVGLQVGRSEVLLHHAVYNSYPDPINSVICLFYYVNSFVGFPRILEADKTDAIKWINVYELDNYELFDPIVSLRNENQL